MKYTKQIDSTIRKIELHTPPIIVRVNKFNEDAAEEFTRDMNKARNSGQPVIPVVID